MHLNMAKNEVNRAFMAKNSPQLKVVKFDHFR